MVKSRAGFRIECRAYFTVIDMFTVVFVFPPYQYSWLSCIWFPVTSSTQWRHHWCQITGKIQEISVETLDAEYKKKLPDFENC